MSTARWIIHDEGTGHIDGDFLLPAIRFETDIFLAIFFAQLQQIS